MEEQWKDVQNLLVKMDEHSGGGYCPWIKEKRKVERLFNAKLCKCTVCGQEEAEICQDCKAEKETIERLKKEINKASSVLHELQSSYLSLTGRQYFG